MLGAALRFEHATGDGDDFTAALLEHLGNDSATGEHGSTEVHVEQKIPISQIGLMNGLAAAPGADGVHERVDAAEARQ